MTEELTWRVSQDGREAHIVVSGSALCGTFGTNWRVVPGAPECPECRRASR